MKISIDVDNRVMTIGKATFTREHHFNSAISFASFVIDKNALLGEYKDALLRAKMNHPNPTAKAMGEILGISAAKLFKTYNALQYKCFIQPIEKYARYVSRSRGKISTQWQERILKNKSICDELLNDNLDKLIPICCVVERTPAQCKELLGKGLWKRLCKLSPTKIGLIANVLSTYIEYNSQESIKDVIGHLLPIKHRVLRIVSPQAHTFFATRDFVMLKWYNDNFAYRVIGRDLRTYCNHWLNVYDDTKRMARQLQREFNPRWNPDDMRIAHDRYVAESHNRKNAEQSILFETEYGCYKDLQRAISEFDSEQYKCVAFRTPKCMLEEGSEQNHCIGSYNLDMHHRDNTVLFKLQTSEGKTYSCVQLIKTPFKRQTNNDCVQLIKTLNQWQINQHYKKHNAPVDCKLALQTVNKIVEHLNSINFVV